VSQLHSHAVQEKPQTIKDKVTGYWAKRSKSFSDMKHEEAHSYKASLWREEFMSNLPGGRALRILDVGCGAGFFELVLAPLGHDVTGIDLTPEMITEAKKLAGSHHSGSAEFLIMDAEKPEFPDNWFDAVISRNLTWTLPHPADAYREWHRVLKPGGVLLNFDAEYAKGFHKYDQSENLAHKFVEDSLVEECHGIYHMLNVSTYDRPEWDIEVLKQIGFKDVRADRTAGDRLYAEKDQFYMPDRMFSIRAVK
jgi:SAM-dependent methyltransferase